MTYESKILRIFVAIAACAALAGACGDEDVPTGNITPGNNSAPDASDDASADADAGDEGDATGDPDVAESDTTSPDVEEPDVVVPEEGPFCDAINMGVLGPNQSTGTVFDLADASNEVQLSCSQGVVAKEIMVRFSVEQASRVKISTTSTVQHGLNLQINRGNCGAPDEVACFNSGTENIIAEAGVEYFITLESVVGTPRGEVEIRVETEALECYPTQSSICEGDTVQVCEAGFELASYACSLGCNTNACAGDTCANAIPMDPSGTMRLEGSFEGYNSEFNMRNRDECFDSGTSIATDGPDIIVALDGLITGQTVRVDTSEGIGDTNDNAVFITKGCAGSTPECVAGADSATEKYEWVVTEDGDYSLIIDLVSVSSPDFVYDITID